MTTWHKALNFAWASVATNALNNTTPTLTISVEGGSRLGDSWPKWGVIDPIDPHSTSGTPEVVEVTGRSGDSVTLTRPNAVAHTGSPLLVIAVTAEQIEELQAAIDALAGISVTPSIIVLSSSVDQSIPTATLTALEFPDEVSNTGGFVVTGDTDIAVPADGDYNVCATAKCADGSGPIAALQIFAAGAMIGEDQRVPAIPASALAGISGLQGFFPMDEASGPCLDAVDGVSATQAGGDQVVSGRPGSGYSHARSNISGHYLNLGAHYNLTGAYTFAAWLYVVSHTGNYATVWGKNSDGGDWDFLIMPGGNLRLYHPGGNMSGGTVLPTGEWVHVALTRALDGSTLIYLNGASDGSGSTGAMPSSGFATMHVGDSPSFPGRNPNAYFSDLCIFNKALTSTEIGNLIDYTHSAIAGNVMAVSIPGAPAAGQTFLAQGYARLSAGDVVTAKMYHEKGSAATVKGLGHSPRIIVEKVG